MGKHIIMVHGRNFKPNKAALKRFWVSALAHGIERDFGKQGLNKFNRVKKTMAYYGELSNTFLGKKTGKRWTKKREADDIEDRKKTLAALKHYGTREFTKSNYHKVRDLQDVFKESLASAISGPLSLLTIGDELVEMVAPVGRVDLGPWWTSRRTFYTQA